MSGSVARAPLAATGLLVAAALLAAAPGRALAAGESIDDPKLERRLGARVDGAGGSSSGGAAGPVDALTPAGPVDSPPDATVAREAAPPDGAGAAAPSVPHVKLGFRRFDFVRIGATDPGSTSGTAASEPFNSVSLDFYPVSSVLRFGLTTQYGWQSGNFGGGGDYFVAQSFSLGAQMPHRQITPFAEAFAGGGYMRRLQFERTVPTVYWQLGIDAGAEVYFSRFGYLSFAVGYLHPVNGFASTETTASSTSASFMSVFVDTWSFKLGVGL